MSINRAQTRRLFIAIAMGLFATGAALGSAGIKALLQ